MTLDRRHFLTLAGVSAGALLLAACSGPTISGGANPSASGTAKADMGPDFTGVTPAKSIDFWSANPGGSQAVTQQIIDAFTAKTGITVNLVAASNYEDVAAKFQTAQAGDKSQLPALVTLSDVWWFRFYLQGQIIALGNALKAAKIDTADYSPVFFGDYTYDGAQWAVPFARSTPLFYYNKTHWKAAGLSETTPFTWEQFASDYAPKLMAANGGKPAYEWGSISGYAGWVEQNLLWGWGGGWSKKGSFDLTTTSDAVKKALQFTEDSIYKGKWAAQAANDSGADLAAGACSATIESAGSFAGIKKSLASAGNPFELGAFALPGGPVATKDVCPTGGTGVAIPAGIDKTKQLAAAQFIAFLTNAENTVTFSKATGYIPVRKSADSSSLDPITQTAIKQSSNTRSQDWARVFLPGGDADMNTMIQTLTTQQADVASAASTLQGQLSTIYTQQVKPYLA
jgi:sn-glycerol 3-phosphate transport system substrate-binding protein